MGVPRIPPRVHAFVFVSACVFDEENLHVPTKIQKKTHTYIYKYIYKYTIKLRTGIAGVEDKASKFFKCKVQSVQSTKCTNCTKM